MQDASHPQTAYAAANAIWKCALAVLTRDQLLSNLRDQIAEILPRDAWIEAQQSALLVDVRESPETATGTAPNAVLLPRSGLELNVEARLPDRKLPLMLMCGSGNRSLLAARDLMQLGYRDVCSVRGGFAAWKLAGLPVTVETGLDEQERQRYARQLILPELGDAGQLKLKAARVLLVGAGGLGSPAALYLAAAGVGQLTLIDGDRVERSNLHRQVLHRDASIGEAKVDSGRTQLLALNPQIAVRAIAEPLSVDNIERLLAQQDLVVDGADNFATRFLLNDAALRARVPWVYGAVHRYEGQVSVFDPRRDDAPCYRCLFPAPPPPEAAPNCAEAGVLGAVPGVIGLLQATEALKLLLGLGAPLTGRLLCADLRQSTFRELKLRRDPNCPGCGDGDRSSHPLREESKACATTPPPHT